MEGKGYPPRILIIPLVHATTTLPAPERVGNYTTLGPFTKEMKEWITGFFDPRIIPVLIPFNGFHAAQVVLAVTIPTVSEWGDMPERDTALQEVRHVLTAMRLLKPGAVMALTVIEGIRNDARGKSGGTNTVEILDFTSGLPFGAHQYLHYSYTVEPSDLADVRAIRERLEKLQPDTRGLGVALRRFNQSYGRQNIADKIIDMAIALESTLLSKGDGKDLTFKLMLRGAALLGRRGWKGQQIYLLLNAFYDARSKIVHEGATLDVLFRKDKFITAAKPHPAAELPGLWEGLVRDTLAEYLSLLCELPDDTTVKDLTEMLEGQIFATLPPFAIPARQADQTEGDPTNPIQE